MNIIKKNLLIFCLLLIISFQVINAQQISIFLETIEQNNTSLAALRQQINAQKTGNRTGIAPANPEFEIGYLWGNHPFGNRTDISVTQTFDFPTSYIHRNKIANLQNENTDLLYQAERINILLAAKQAYIQLIYYNALAKEYLVRQQQAEQFVKAYTLKVEQGDASILEKNKAEIKLATIRIEMSQISIERSALQAELKRLNGGKDFEEINSVIFPNSTLPVNFQEWYIAVENKSPMLQYASGQIAINRQEVKLNRTMSLPKFSAGYMSEKLADEHFQGLTIGVSVPLWENVNQIKKAKLQTSASEAFFEDSKMQFNNRLYTLYSKASSLKQLLLGLKESLTNNNNATLLQKAFDAGEMSLHEYLLEIEIYYETIDKLLEIERDYELTVAELQSVEL